MQDSPQPSVPSVIRSRQQIASQTAAISPDGPPRQDRLPIVADGTTYNMVQEAAWLDSTHFAVGRWDGSLCIFAFSDSPTAGPVISKGVNTPAFEGVQMIARLAPTVFASSNDGSSICVWTTRTGDWTDVEVLSKLTYNASWGAANSGDTLLIDSRLFFVAGHANGFATIWEGDPEASCLRLRSAVDLRNPRPTNPWGLHNIRGVAALALNDDEPCVAAGSEDGYISIVRVHDGALRSQTVYNPAAQRGINSVAALGRNLLVANCSVGRDDKNLWYYEVDARTSELKLRDSVNLQQDTTLAQTFNFCTRWSRFKDAPCFFSSTEEGLLWMGILVNQRLAILGSELVYGHLGSALAVNPDGKLVVANYNLYEFKIPQR